MDFPSVIIPSKGFLLIFASGKNILDTTELHTNFKIKQSGEALFLSNSNQVISTLPAVDVPVDYSYGLLINGMYITFHNPTPEVLNITDQDVYASHHSGYYDEEFLLMLISINNNQKIYYTENGKIPTINDKLYTSPLLIKNNSNYPNSISDLPTTVLQSPPEINQHHWQQPNNVYKGNVIRYALFENDSLVSPIYSKTYFVDSMMHNRYSFPVISIVTDSLNLFDYEKGIFIPGKRFDDLGFTPYPNGNYNIQGEEGERPIHLTFFESDGLIGFESDAGMRICGQGSTLLPQKSLNIYFKDEYGKKEIDYPLFKYTDVNKRLILRNSGQNFLKTHFRDAILQSIIEPLGMEHQDFQPSILFINGEYWGIHNVREKYDRFYFKNRFGIDEDSINILNHVGHTEEGNNLDYIQLLNYVSDNDLSEMVHYEYVKSKIDIENFINFQIAEIYFANFDWPCNNYKIWKTNEADSKWRFMIYDLDVSFGSSDIHNGYNRLGMSKATLAYEESPGCQRSNKLFINLLKNEQFNALFIEQFETYLNTIFDTENVINQINEFRHLYEPEIQEHIDRWNYPSNITEWYEHINAMKKFAIHRPCFMKEDLMDFFELESFDYDCVDEDDFKKVSDLLIYPNPSQYNITIQNTIPDDCLIGNITLFNTNGQIVFYQKDVVLKNDNTVDLNISDLSNGIYFLRYQNVDFIATEKLLIMK